ncbi:MAG: TonB-dependent receptor [Cyclobacteriaceae bacterium]
MNLIKHAFAFIVVIISFTLQAQEYKISGTVIDKESKEALIGATILEKGTTNGTITDFDGGFELTISSENALLDVSYIGYLSQEVNTQGRSLINISLALDISELEEIVVIGYGSVRKSDLTGSVSSLRGDDLVKIPSASPEQALQGKMAGVQVISNSGAPGESPTVRIRGVGTFENADPIFVVDGLILDDISFLNSADIESIEVLKDASATAMYGSRGANGVIIVSTKAGQSSGKIQVNVNSEFNIQTIQKYVDVLDDQEFGRVIQEVQPGTFNNLALLEHTDWQQEVYRDYAPIHNHQLSVSGGGEKSTYYLGAGYFKQEGVIPKSGYERITLKINNVYKPANFLKLGHNFTITETDKKNGSSVVASTLRAWPTDAPYTTHPVTGERIFANVRGNGNPLAAIEFNNSSREALRAVGNFYGEFSFLKNFTLRSSYGIDNEYTDDHSFTPVFFVSPQQNNDQSRISKAKGERTNWLWENTLSYQLDLPRHSINAVIGYTTQEDNFEDFNGRTEALLRDDIQYINSGLAQDLTEISINQAASIQSRISYLFRVNYVAMDKYLFTATYRRDGSSIFSDQNRWGDFPSFAVGWRIIDESFMQDISFLSNLKLRASWGIIGNDKIDASDRFTTINTNAGAVFGASDNEILYPGATYGTTGNPALRWEESQQTDIGLEAGFYNDKLTFEFDYYNKLTKDILISLGVPAHLGNGGFATVRYNAASVRNEGLEFTSSWRDHVSNVDYGVTLMATTVKNKVTKMGDSGAENAFLTGNLGNGQSVKRVAIGEPIGYFYGYKIDGVFQNESELDLPRTSQQGVGDFRFVDVTGDGEITPDDRTFLGSPIPDLIYGLSANASYRGFEISMDFQGELGKEIYDGKDAVRASQYNYQSRVLNYWTGEGSTNSEPRLSASGPNYSPSDWFIQDGSYLRLRTLTLAYNLPQTLIDGAKIQSAKVYLRGTNLFTITEYDGYTPEIGGGLRNSGIDTGLYPVTSVYAIGVNLGF